MSASPIPPPVLLDLRPNRSLLNAHFDGYKLSLQPLAKLRAPLVEAPGRRHPADDQYSYLHAQLFSTHNHLHRDPYNAGLYVYLDAAGCLRTLRYSTDTGRLAADGGSRLVYAPPRPVERYAGDYNGTVQMVGAKWALLADGSGGLSVLETGDRRAEAEADEGGQWRAVFETRPLDDVGKEEEKDTVVAIDSEADDGLNDATTTSRPFVLLDARLDTGPDGHRSVHCILLHIRKRGDTFESCLDWVVCEQLPASSSPAAGWSQRHLRRLSSRCMPQYCALEADGGALLLAGDWPFVLEGVDDVQRPPAAAAAAGCPPTNGQCPFSWHQTNEDVIIRFAVPATAQTADFRVVTEKRRVVVATEAGPLLEAELFAEIEAGLTTWLLENESLTLTLVKEADDRPDWPRLRSAEEEAEQLVVEVTDAVAKVVETKEEFLDNGARAAFAMAGAEMEDMEDCDYGGNDAQREFFLERLEAGTNRRTHKCPLGTQPPLFRLSRRAGHPDALALRHDVDICIWQPPLSCAAASKDDTAAKWLPQHEGTLDAIGYVQASKTQKKYLQCSPDLRTSVISEAQRHVFVYQSHCEAAAGLKNRRTGGGGGGGAARVSVGQQRLLAMEAGDEICGLVVEDEVIVLLTDREVICVQMNA